MDLVYGKTNQKPISKFIKIFMNKKRNNIKPGGDVNVDENSLQRYD